MYINCALIFLNTILVEKGDKKEANVEKYGKPIENVFISCASTTEPVLWNWGATTTEDHTSQESHHCSEKPRHCKERAAPDHHR